MHHSLLELIACPLCRGTLTLQTAVENATEIQHGLLYCEQCGAHFAIEDGMPHLYGDDESWAPKAIEAQGWVTLHKELGIYEQGADAIDLKIPYHEEGPWPGVARGFDLALEQLSLTGDEVILDLGAGRGWAAKQFALRGCRVVALDIVPDCNVGLGRAAALMADAGVHFERVIGDGERLPFHPGSFDIVFCHAALHHAVDLGAMLSSAACVLKTGGRLCAVEPTRSVTTDEEALLARSASKELELGIHETRPTVAQYLEILSSNGLQPEELKLVYASEMDQGELLEWARDCGARLAPPRWNQPGRSFWRTYNYLKLRLRLLVLAQNKRPPLNPPATLNARAQLAYQIALCQGEEVVLLARKESRLTNPSIQKPTKIS
jgi:uncharacterized protein YbaR (Trm112 family)/ubiquinone/menaquinone biosynthesis C-methylase UbiE